jgi:hypothetical protein
LAKANTLQWEGYKMKILLNCCYTESDWFKMLTEGFVTAIMEASITGAGLVLAVFALVASLSRRIHKIEGPQEKIEEIKKLPKTLGASLSLTFLFYMLSFFMAYGWFLEPSLQASYELLLKIFFLVSNGFFTIFGFSVLVLVYSLMERESR